MTWGTQIFSQALDLSRTPTSCLMPLAPAKISMEWEVVAKVRKCGRVGTRGGYNTNNREANKLALVVLTSQLDALHKFPETNSKYHCSFSMS